MLLSMFAARRFDQRASINLSYWTVESGTVYVARLVRDPNGPMSAQDALEWALEECLAELRRRRSQRAAGGRGEVPPAAP